MDLDDERLWEILTHHFKKAKSFCLGNEPSGECVSPESDLRHYSTNFITNAIIKLDFPTVLGLDVSHPPSELQEKICDNYPLLETLRGKQVQLDFDEEDVSLTQENRIMWKFLSKDKKRILQLTPESAIFEFQLYDSFQIFFDEFKKITDILLETYPIRLIKRIGVRYINQINIDDGNPLDWGAYIKEELLAPLNYHKTSGDMLRTMQLVDLHVDGYHFRIRFGMPNREYPNPITRKDFVLDFDCFLVDEIDVGKIPDIITECNQIIYRQFENSIEDGLRNIMDG